MKRLLVITALLLGWTSAQEAIRESAAPLVGALGAYADNLTVAYLPGYGLQVSGYGYLGGDIASEAESYTSSVAGTVAALAPTIEGLGEGEWVSVALYVKGFISEGTGLPDEVFQDVLIRVRGAVLEVWIDGELQ